MCACVYIYTYTYMGLFSKIKYMLSRYNILYIYLFVENCSKFAPSQFFVILKCYLISYVLCSDMPIRMICF